MSAGTDGVGLTTMPRAARLESYSKTGAGITSSKRALEVSSDGVEGMKVRQIHLYNCSALSAMVAHTSDPMGDLQAQQSSRCWADGFQSCHRE